MNRILWNERGEDIDEIVMEYVDMVHIEQMDDRVWWVGLYQGNRRFSGFFQCNSRGRMSFYEGDCEIAWDEDEEHEAPPDLTCENCGGQKCMGCVLREWDHECADDCPSCCSDSHRYEREEFEE